MEKPKVTFEYKVGFFVIMACVLFVITIYLLGGDKAFLHSYVDYKVNFNSIAGINKGSVVQLLGLNVGNVKEVAINPQIQGITITLKVDKEFQQYFTKGTTAGVRTQGALGDKFIYISPGPGNTELLASNAVIENEPDSDLLSVLSAKGKDFNRVFDIVNELSILLKSMNSNNRTSTIMQNLTESSQTLNQTLHDLKSFTSTINGKNEGDNKLKKSLVHLSSILEKIDNGQGTLGELINDPSLYQDLQRIVGGSKNNKFLKGVIRTSIQKSE